MPVGSSDDITVTSRVRIALGVEGLSRDRVKVETTDGLVKITGLVDREEQIESARRIALQQEGVRGVELDLKVGSPS